MSRLNARELVDLVLDDGSWQSWDSPPEQGTVAEQYAAELAAAAERSGVDESVVTGEALMRGRRVAVVIGEFGFLAGSIGRAAADRLVAAVERATAEGLPLLAGPVSGGTRMQEGTPAFVQMVRISQAVAAHKAAGLPYLVYLRHPTTGGVMASWGSLGHVTVAEPGRAGGLPRPAGLRGALRPAVPRGRADRREPLRPRASSTPSSPRSGIADILDRALDVLHGAAARASRPSPSRPATTDPRRRHLGRGHPVPTPATGPAYAACCSTPPPTSSPSTAPARARPTPGC